MTRRGWRYLWLGLFAVPVVLVALARRAPPSAQPSRALARSVSQHLESFVARHRQVIAELAARFGDWEALPGPVVRDAFAGAAGHHPDLLALVLADPAGRIQVGYDARRPPGGEALASGRLDPMLERRQVLVSGPRVRVALVSQAGRVRWLDIAAAIRDARGVPRGYVGALLSLRSLRREWESSSAGRASAGRFSVLGRGGEILFPCGGHSPGGTIVSRGVSGFFQVRVATKTSKSAVLFWVGLAAALLWACAGLLVFRPRRRPNQSRREPRAGSA